MTERKCVICGKMFVPKSSRRSFCYEPHYHPCPICGEPVLTKDTYHLTECCCPAHSRQLANKTEHERFGSNWPSSSDAAKAKRKQTSLDRYGVDNPAKLAEIRTRISDGLHARYAIDGDDIRERARQTYFARTGYYSSSQNPEVIARIKSANLKKYGVESTFAYPPFKAKADATNFERYGSIIPMQNPKVWAKYRSKRSQYKGCDGTLLDSTYEVSVYDYCIRNGIPIKRTVPISFEYDGMQHKTFIDFEIDGMLVEVKGEHILDGFFDWQPGAVPISTKLEIYKKYHVIVITGIAASHYFSPSNGLKYLDKCAEPLIGVDIQLFREPCFPYREDRPKCFYDVCVGNQLSAFNAFNDERIRWKMIKNRIDYMGGFISSRQVLTALNVTRTAKQPSWFSLSYAQYILKKYSTESTIVDPFAGWGTRHDAAISLHKRYIGCDLNPELVEWHQQHGRSIQLGDAKQFEYAEICDVFICPPYKDTEIYIPDQDLSLTQCEWLNIVRQNVPNARRYIMVCKLVDDGFQEYVREVKENKSHFGVNHEYVVVIDNPKYSNKS